MHEFEIELFSTGFYNHEFDRNADPSADLCLIVCRVDNNDFVNGLTCLTFEHSVEYYITASANLSPGHYIIYATSIKAISPLNNRSKTADYATYNIVFHGRCPFTINRSRLSSEAVAEIFFSVAKMQKNCKDELNGQVRSYVIHGSCTHGIFIENLSYHLSAEAFLDTSTSANLESTRLVKQSYNSIRPRCRELLAFLTPMDYRSGYVIGYKLDIKPSNNLNDSRLPPIAPNYAGLHATRLF